ncbi:adenylosuccinate lyase [Pseudoruegeria sp. HB172150]|uniref:adenylosuccinate lyase n=1 Tax=Pseudoruegeria sp. HB172150 TaxID=2721164 RepID=UPI001557073C|nr:adenylosuccinate lyase [Pseudoruegeria sp. HB172150]
MTRTLIVAAVLALTPMVAAAECSFHKEEIVMTCVDGTVYDAQSRSCVKVTG